MEEQVDGIASEARPHSRVTRAELFEGYRVLVEKVAASYVDCRAAEPLGAVQWDPQKHRRGKTADVIHFLADVQQTVEHALRMYPDRPDLIRRFLRMANSPDRLDQADRRMVEKLGPLFRARGLNPGRYFVPSRRVEHKGIASLSDSLFMVQANAASAEEIIACSE